MNKDEPDCKMGNEEVRKRKSMYVPSSDIYYYNQTKSNRKFSMENLLKDIRRKSQDYSELTIDIFIRANDDILLFTLSNSTRDQFATESIFNCFMN